jgi:hypothetical protein
MKNNFKKLLFGLMLLFLGVTTESFAQYNTGIGLRAGSGNGLTVKHFLNEGAAIEGILHTRWRGLVITGLYEVHRDIREVRGLQWFYGGGAHLGTWNANNRNTPWGDNSASSTIVGLDGIIGLDYKFINAPINLSLDWKPTLNFGDAGFWGDEVALSIRFAF